MLSTRHHVETLQMNKPMPFGEAALSVQSDDSENEANRIDQEIAFLQRQFRITEGQRQLFGTEWQEVIKKQLLELEKLSKEQNKLQKEICSPPCRDEKETTERMFSMAKHLEKLNKQLREEKTDLGYLDQEISSLEKILIDEKKERCGRYGPVQSLGKLTKSREILENRLDFMLARLHQQLVKNDELRKELDNVQIERSIFEQIHLKLEKERQEIRRKISHGIHASTAAYEERVDAQCNLVVLREQSRKKQAQHAIEIENFKRSIDHDKRLKDFMRIKFDTQRVLAMDVFEAGRDETESGNGQTYEEAFHKIHEITKESDPDVLVRRFMEADDRKIALFSYVLEQTREIGRVQEDLEETKKKITLSYKECLHHEEDHQALVTKMKTELAEIQQETDGYRQKAKDMKMMQAQLHKGIDSMVTRIGCDRSRIENRLGNSAGVQSYNMMSYLRLMEQRISELLRIWSYIRLKESEKQYSQRDSSNTLRNQIPKTPQLLIPPSFSIVIQTPSTVEDADTEDRDRLLTGEEVWPLSEEELRERILSMILRREERTLGMNKADVANQPKKHSPGNE